MPNWEFDVSLGAGIIKNWQLTTSTSTALRFLRYQTKSVVIIDLSVKATDKSIGRTVFGRLKHKPNLKFTKKKIKLIWLKTNPFEIVSGKNVYESDFLGLFPTCFDLNCVVVADNNPRG
jgi:hypothetical protein